MASEKTSNIGLNKWVPSDYVKVDEFNDNFDKIDEVAADHAAQLADKAKQINLDAIAININVKFPRLQGELNDTPRMQRAVDSFGTTGGVLFFPTGTYIGRIEVGSNVTILGAGRDLTTIQLPDNTNNSIVKNKNRDTNFIDKNITIKDISFDGNMAKQTTNADAVSPIYLKGVDGVKIQNVSVKNGHNANIFLHTCINTFVDKVLTDTTQIHSGIVVTGVDTNIKGQTVITNSIILNSALDGIMATGYYINIKDCYIYNSGVKAVENGFLPAGGIFAGSSSRYCKFTHNTIIKSTGIGIDINGAQDTEISYNTVEQNDYAGIWVYDISKNIIVSYNIVRNNCKAVTSSSNYGGIGCGSFSAEGNTPSKCRVLFNKVYDDQPIKTQWFGIVSLNTDDHDIFGNDCYGNATTDYLTNSNTNSRISKILPTPKFGTSTPTIKPDYIGQEYLDTTNKKVYKAFGTSSSADWALLN